MRNKPNCDNFLLYFRQCCMVEVRQNGSSYSGFPNFGNTLITKITVTKPINQSIIYLNTLRLRAKKLVQNTNVYQ